jgi:glycosyltransferase involved in cell wall biosynthesis
MKVLTITANDNSLGGASRIAMDLHDGILKAGHQSFVFTGKKETSSDLIKEIRRPLWRKVFSKLMSNDIDFFNTDYLMSLNEFKTADIVHFHNLSGWYFNLTTLKKMSQLKPVVWTLHDMWSINPHSGYTLSRTLTNKLYNVSDDRLYPQMLWNNDRYLSFKKTQIYETSKINVVTPCNWLAGLLESTSLGSHLKKTIYNGVDTEIFKIYDGRNLKKNLGLNNSPVILFVGAGGTKNMFKGYEDFFWLSSQVEMRNYQFVCVGASENSRSDNLTFVKATSDKKAIAKYLACADIFVMPSRFETFPLVILEAMACGTHIIAYDVGGVSEVLKKAQYCYLVEPNNKKALLEATKKLIYLDKSVIKNNSIKLRQIIEKSYSKKSMVKHYLMLYQSLLKNNRSKF